MILQRINPAQSQYFGPAIFNSNYEAIETAFNSTFEMLDVTNKKMLLASSPITVPNGSVAADVIVAAATAGNVLAVNPGGTGNTFAVTFDGKISAIKITATGTGANASSFGDVNVSGDMAIQGNLALDAVVDLTSATTLSNVQVVAITNTSIGASATTPLDLSTTNWVLLDCYNGGSPLADTDENQRIKIDTTTLEDGQVVRFQLLKDNIGEGVDTDGTVRLYNGTSGNEIFAITKISGSGQGFSAVSFSDNIRFDNTEGISYLTARWMSIDGGSTFRFVILETVGVLIEA